MKRAFAFLFLAVAAVWSVSLPAQAQRYPEKPVRLVVPFPPGGGSDILARAIAPKLAEFIGQPVVVENRAGAGGNIGAEAVAKAAPDGYTLLFGSNTLPINAGLYPKLPFDTAKDFAPVGMVASAAMVLVVHPAVSAGSVRELIALAKANPDKLNFSTPGNGTPHHLAAELFNRLAGTQITHVLYKGAGPALTDVVGGQTQVAVLTLAAAKPHIASGKLRALGVAPAKRSQVMPELPTIAEAGVAGYEADLWYALFAPAGTPREIVNLLNRELGKVLALQEVRERLGQQGFDLATSTPERLGEILNTDLAKYGKLIRESNIRAE
jgi:tripartite-type tricarboxylate transporter receptor subunit TctC